MKRLLSIALALFFAVALATVHSSRAQVQGPPAPAPTTQQQAVINALAGMIAGDNSQIAAGTQANATLAQNLAAATQQVNTLTGQLAQAQAQAQAATNQHTGWLATNLSASNYYTPQVHADLCRQSGPFYDVGDGQASTRTSTGYPVGMGIHCRSINWLEDVPAGTLNVTWTGTAMLTLSVYGPGTWTVTGANSGTLALPQRGTVTTQPSVNTPSLVLFIDVTNSAPNAPLANLHIWQPGYGPGTANANRMFTTAYTSLLGQYSCLRLMKSTLTETNADVNPADRVQAAAYDQTTRGECVEDLIELVKETGVKRAWFCMAPNASVAYQQQVLQLLHDGLPGVVIVLEYSDEPWNQGGSNITYATVNNLANITAINTYDGTYNAAGKFVPTPVGSPQVTDTLTRAVRAAADLEYKLATTAQPIFADNPARLQCVLSSQSGNSYWASEGLHFIQGKYGSVSVFKALIEAPYFMFWPDSTASVPTGPNGTYLLSDLMNGTAVDFQRYVLPAVTAHQAIAKQYGLLHYLYEAGQSNFPQDNPYDGKDLSTALSNSPEFGLEYFAYYSLLHAQSDMCCDFAFGPGYWDKWGYWSTVQSITATDNTGPTATNCRYVAQKQIIGMWN